MASLKEKLYGLCLDYVKTRLDIAEQGIRETQEAQNDDTKSSAGDKYETGREMMQQETNRHLVQLTEANKLRVIMNSINPAVQSITAIAGSLIYTNNGNFYLAISAGSLQVEDKAFYAVSPASPIGAQLAGKKAGDNFTLNGKLYEILKVE